MPSLKKLVGQTAVYGLSSILGRFLNYLLVPLYTYKIAAESGGYGIVTNLYAYTALLLVLLTFGMETTFFYFANRDDVDSEKAFSTSAGAVGLVSLLFWLLCMVFGGPIANVMDYEAHPEFIRIMATVVALDSFQAILFARLRYQNRAFKFAALKLAFIIANIGLNLFIFLAAPALCERCPNLMNWYDPAYQVGYIFVINLICTAAVTFGFIPELRAMRFGIDRGLLKQMLRYTWPLLILGLVGILNQVADKICYRFLVPGPEGEVQLGIYGACVKIAMIMALLTQAFRYAYEPIVFADNKDKNNPATLADGTKYFIIFTLLAFLAVMFYMPLLQHYVGAGYREGLGVIPIVMMAEIFMGVYFNLSFWYKLTDQNWWGAIISSIGVAVMVAVNVIFVPRIGYWACAWGGFAGYGVSMLLSYFIGQKKYPIKYDLGRIALFFVVAAAMFAVYEFWLKGLPEWPAMGIGTVLLLLYCVLVYREIRGEKTIAA